MFKETQVLLVLHLVLLRCYKIIDKVHLTMPVLSFFFLFVLCFVANTPRLNATTTKHINHISAKRDLDVAFVTLSQLQYICIMGWCLLVALSLAVNMFHCLSYVYFLLFLETFHINSITAELLKANINIEYSLQTWQAETKRIYTYSFLSAA